MISQRKRIAGSLAWQLISIRLSSADNKKHQTNRLLFEKFRHLGGIYIKFLQILSLNISFLQGWAGPSEFDIFEAAPFEEIDMQQLLERELPNYQQQFLSIDTVPFAAGSFAQVYHGTLRDNTKVIIKVLRPSLARNLNSDLRLLGLIARLSSLLFPTGIINIREVYKQFASTVRGETDYLREVQNASWFYKYFKDNPDVVIPRTYAELSGKHLLVQDYVGGTSLAEVLQAQKMGQGPTRFVADRVNSNIWQQLEILGTELLVASVTADFVIGDPHPGNIKLLPNNQVGLIDFGIAASAPSNRGAFLKVMREYEKVYADTFDISSFTLAALDFIDEDLSSALRVAGQYLSPNDPDTFIKSIGQSATMALNEAQSDEQTQQLMQRRKMMHIFNRSINKNNRFGISFNLESTAMIKSAITYLQMVEMMGDGSQKTPVVHSSIVRAISIIESRELSDESEAKQSPGIEQALEVISSWLEKIADNDPFLYRQITARLSA